MQRYRLTIEYDGRPFVGFQRQDNGPSVQACLEAAIFAASAEDVTVRGAGRTDTGVHATGQVIHIDLEKTWLPEKLQAALNAHMRPQPVAVLAASITDEAFDARFSATARHYRYIIINRRAPLTFDKGLAWHVPVPLDAEAMHEAAQALVGKHDFTTFRAAQCQANSPVRSIDKVDVARYGERIEITVSARSFLHNQVRSITGSLKKTGDGSWPVERMAGILSAADRSRCGPVAPPDGLYLEKVDYPE